MPPSEIRDVLLSRAELLALRELRNTHPLRILSDGACAFWFDFGDRYLAATTEEFVALSQNEHDEVLAVRPRWHGGPCTPEGARLLFENVLVADVLVVRSLIWFTNHVRFETEEQALAGVPTARNDTERALREVLSRTTGGHEERLTNPRSVAQVLAPVANLVDVGFVAVVGDRHLASFVQSNAYLRQADFLDQLRHDSSIGYEQIPVDTALVRAV